MEAVDVRHTRVAFIMQRWKILRAWPIAGILRLWARYPDNIMIIIVDYYTLSHHILDLSHSESVLGFPSYPPNPE